MKNKSLTAAIIALMPLCAAARDFVHPGLSYTDDDLERMRSAIAIGVEPAMSTYEALKASHWTQFEADEITPVERIYESQFNNTVGADGRRIHDLALLYRLSGDRRYADEAVRRINRYKDLRGCSARGTAPLDNGKIYLMIEGAELLRDYDGWSDDDRKAFADMLLYPGYSDTTYPDERRDGFNDEANDINFYWNICNFDTGRWGNQGLFAARALIAIGVFLDNEKIYDRAMRILELFSDDENLHIAVQYTAIMDDAKIKRDAALAGLGIAGRNCVYKGMEGRVETNGEALYFRKKRSRKYVYRLTDAAVLSLSWQLSA